jgi:hypothetical protein
MLALKKKKYIYIYIYIYNIYIYIFTYIYIYIFIYNNKNIWGNCLDRGGVTGGHICVTEIVGIAT